MKTLLSCKLYSLNKNVDYFIDDDNFYQIFLKQKYIKIIKTIGGVSEKNQEAKKLNEESSSCEKEIN